MLSHMSILYYLSFFFFNDTATTEIYTLSLHDALPISRHDRSQRGRRLHPGDRLYGVSGLDDVHRSEEHTSELQSLAYLVCRLLLEKKKKIDICIVSDRATMILALVLVVAACRCISASL